MAVHEVVENLDGEVDGAAGKLKLLGNNARPVHQVAPTEQYSTAAVQYVL